MDTTQTLLQKIASKGGERSLLRTAEVREINAESRTVELAFSSETEVKRWWGFEVLSHDPGAVVLDRMEDAAPLLMDHNWRDQIGVIESVSIDADRRGRCVVRFGKSARADEIFQDVQDGIRKHVSVGYLIHEAKLTETREDDVDVYTITRWEPYEVSIVPVPADTSVGIGRDMDQQEPATPTTTNHPIQPQERVMPEPTETTKPLDADAIRAAAAGDINARNQAIAAIGDKYDCRDLALKAIAEGTSVPDFQARVLEHWNSRIQQPLDEQARGADIGLSPKEIRKFSVLKVVRALIDPSDKQAQREAAFEFEVSEAAAAKREKQTGHFCIPTDILRTPILPADAARAFNTGTDGGSAGNTGGYTIATTMLSQSFIEILRNRATAMQLGMTVGGLVGNIDIPKQVAAATAYWLGEDEDTTETGIELGQIGMTPKTIGAFSEITRKLTMQSSMDVEAMVRMDLAKALALGIDKAVYYGTGSKHQPLGLLNHSGVNAQTFATAGRPTFAELVEMETKIALDNADVSSMAYVANASFRGHAKTTEKFASTGMTLWEPGNTVNGYRTEITNQVNAGDVIMGNFSDLLIGMWGGLDLMVDPYSGSKKGRLRIVVFQDLDVAVRRVESFCLGRAA